MIVMPIDAGEHWLLLDISMIYVGGWYLTLMHFYYLLRVWEWHEMDPYLLFIESLRMTQSEYVTSPFL